MIKMNNYPEYNGLSYEQCSRKILAIMQKVNEMGGFTPDTINRINALYDTMKRQQ